MGSRNFTFEDGGYLRVEIRRNYIDFTICSENRYVEADIVWRFESKEAMQEEMAGLIKRDWAWKPDEYAEAFHYNGIITTKNGIELWDGRVLKVLPEVKAWLKEQFQKPKLKPESEELIDYFYETAITQILAKDELRGLLLQVLEIEGK